MSPLSTFRMITSGAKNRIADARRRRQALATIEMLPDHLRKDIGWPNSDRFDR